MKEILRKLYRQETLSAEEAGYALDLISEDQVHPAQMASFITVYLLRAISVSELDAFINVLMKKCIPVELGRPTLDVCGTGGDEKNTFNISTITALLAASCGVSVAKHGNYGVSSISGSSNVLEHCGYQFSNDVNELKQQLESESICFLHAPLFHPALKHVAQVRKELGVRTFFNMLGPLVNPARPTRRMVGVYQLDLARTYHYLLQQRAEKYHIVHSYDGYDEISLTSDFKVFSHNGEKHFSADSFGFAKLKSEAIEGGETIAESAEIFKKILSGKGTDAQNAVVLVNTVFALQTVSNVSTSDALELATERLLSGSAFQLFKRLIS
ncbi:MAG: anthranilate phosphoribosyltransferase [Saprospiraceae bacterium]|nr:anthranilate phosphoribosyltransferase [Saprospiraceae bacterium]